VIAERLRTIPLFAGLSGKALEVLAGQITLERYAADETIVRQGEPGDTLYIISRGEVEVVHAAGSAARRLNTLTAGDYFGEMALLSDEPRAATVRTTTPTHLYSLARPDFEALLAREPAIRHAVEEAIAARRASLSAILVTSST
jgi:CRP-like cAMP-binding protein